MKPLLLFLFLFVFSVSLTAQNGTWTWMKGDSALNTLGVYGIQTVPSPLVTPPSVYEAAEWTDLNGNFWMFGGIYMGPNGGYNSALWRYEPATNNWTWMKGPSVLTAIGVYGVQGVPSPLNYPSGRGFGTTTWIDLNGNLWMFGGAGIDASGLDSYLNELWMYNVGTNEWTWMGGSLTGNAVGNFGQVTVPAPTNWPPPKCETAVSWVDNSGDLWLFGGISFPSNGSYDDIWRYTIATATWTWMSGQQPNATSTFTTPNYGQLGVPAPSNTPGSRVVYNRWKDLQGRFWLFGGNLLTAPPVTLPADMWMYDPATLLWTWMAGTSTNNDTATFTATCVPGGLPSGCFEDRACWTDECGRFWSMSTGSGIFYSHLWLFDPTTLQFTWVTGTLTYAPLPVYGIKGVPSPTNYPDGTLGANAFLSQQGELWLYGGLTANGFGGTNSLWRYQPDPLCTGLANLTTTATADSSGCAPFAMQFGTAGNPAIAYQWDFGDPSTVLDTSTAAAPSYNYTTPGTYTVTLISSYGTCNPDSDTSFVTIQVLQNPIVSLGPDTTLCPGQTLLLDAQNAGASFLWNTGTNTQILTAASAGSYSVVVNNQGCVARDTIEISVSQNVEFEDAVSLCGSLTGLVLDAGNLGATYLWNTGETTQIITVQQAGTYWVTVNAAPCILSDTLEVTGSSGEAAVYIPNSFTPNGDGLNDRFTGVGENFTSFHLVIFNRWGELIFETHDQSGWDGNYVGQRAESEVYVYLLSYTSTCTGGKVVDRRGAVKLIR